MCNFWSCIITREGKVVWGKESNSHEDQIKKAGLKDNKLEDRDFVRIEISPKKHELIFSKKKKDWKLKVDEDKTLPVWFTKNRKKKDVLLWREWKKAMKGTLWKLDLKAAEKVVSDVKKIKYFSMKGKPLKSWSVSLDVTVSAAWDAAGVATWDAAWAAAGVAAWDAAGDAAGVAAWVATWDAAWAAAGVAARGAAGDAAWVAAWVAARDAARGAARDARLLAYVKLARLKGKHLKHAEARMDVWRRGYGLRCDVNGKLFVYGVKK